MKRKLVAVLAAIAVSAGSGVSVAAAAVGPPGILGPGLLAVGPINAADGFPVWYKDRTGLRLEPCLDTLNPMCPAVGPRPNEAAPVAFPANYPEESFYSRTEALLPVVGGQALSEIQLEQAFNTGAAAVGEQITFARTRFRFPARNGVSYKVTSPATPPGGKLLVATGGQVFDTEDIGIGAPGVFSGALGGRMGPFLTWNDYKTVPADVRLKPNALGKATYVGDGLTPHLITGSPYNTNFFRIEGPGINPSPTIDACPTLAGNVLANCVETNLFAVQGKLATVSGVTADQATYSRSAATDGFVDVFASSDPDSLQAIQVSDVTPAPAVAGFVTRGLKGSLTSLGHYFGHVAYVGAAPPKTVQVSNTSDLPVTNKVIDVVDKISGTANYTPGLADGPGVLAITAGSSDTAVPRILTASGFAAAPVALTLGSLTVPALDAPPVSVTVTSDAGGSVDLPVLVNGAPVANAGPAQTVSTGQLVTLDGSASLRAVTYAWTSPAGIVLSNAAAVKPTFIAPAVPGVYPFALTVTSPGGTSTATVLITVIASVPDAPVIGTATVVNTTATLTWTAPANNGGSAITGYLVRVVDAAGQVGALRPAAATATSLDIPGLATVPVSFQVQAVNAVGTGLFSALSNSVTPLTVPAAPVTPTATAGDTTATVTWTAPADGGSPLTGYNVQMVDVVTGLPVGALLPALAGATSLDVTGLVNGTAVSFQVQAINAVGTGLFSGLSTAVTPAPPTVPGVPVIATVTPGDTSATVNWTAPANGGSAITGYSVQQVDAAGLPVGALLPALAGATSLTVTGLVNGIPVQFQVQATNVVGASAFSASSATVTPAAVPGIPTIGTATVVDTTATVTWTVPADGGSPITGYDVQVVNAVTGLPTGVLLPAVAGATSLVMTTLVNGTAVQFQVQARNVMGSGAFSALSNAVTPTVPVTVPSAPVIGTPTPGDGTATVTWIAPANGGSAITGYSVQMANAAGVPVGAPLLVAAGATSLVVTGLVNGTPVTFLVQATNAIGAGAFSALSATVTPAAVPSAPAIGVATAADTTATVNWTAPADNGSLITGYSVQQVDAAGLPVGALLPALAGATSLVVTGLVNGTPVQFKVQATNVVGTGLFSAVSNIVVPAGAPSAPAIGVATAGDTTATVNWTAPASNGSPITGYSVRVVAAATGLQLGALLPAPAGATSLAVTGLVNRTVVQFQVQATNAVGTGLFSALSNAVIPVASRISDFNGDGFTDMVALDTRGTAWLYPGNGAGAFLPRTLIANGWSIYRAIVSPGDLTGDGNADLLAVNGANQVRLYPGNGAGGFTVSRVLTIAVGTPVTEYTSAGDMTGDGRVDLLARDGDGVLWLYPTTGNAVFGTRVVLGATGWDNMASIMGAGDLTGDGKADLLARDNNGILWLYRGNGAGVLGARTQVSAGWRAMITLLTPGNFNGVLGNDMMALDGAGTLWLYPGNNAGAFSGRLSLGAGFKGFILA